MNIAIFSATLPPYPCGVGKHAYFLANALQQLGSKVTIVTLDTNNQSLAGQFKLDPSLNKFGLFQYLKWARANKGKFDMVHLQYPTKLNRRGISVVLLPWILRCYGFKATLTLHELSEASLFGKIRNIILATGFSRIILPNPQDAAWLPHKTKAIQHITLGPTLVSAKPNPPRLPKFSIGFLGFMDGSKGEQDLLSAAAQLKSKVNLYFLTRFDPQQNPHHTTLDQQVKSLNISDMVKWINPQDDQQILDYLQAVDVVVMPFTKGVTRRNSTLLEAIVASKPLIVSDGGHLPDYLQPPQNCLTFQPGHINQLAESIDRLAEDRQLMSQLIKQTARLATQFKWSTIAQQTVAVYRK